MTACEPGAIVRGWLTFKRDRVKRVKGVRTRCLALAVVLGVVPVVMAQSLEPIGPTPPVAQPVDAARMAADVAVVQEVAEGGLTLDAALDLAKERNGTIRAALEQVRSSEQNILAARSAFAPTVTARLSREDSRFERFNSPRLRTDTNATTTTIDLAYTILDNGSRRLSLDQALLDGKVSELQARQTLRQVLFTVQQRFFDALRAQQILRARSEQVKRAQELFDSIMARIEAGDLAPKDRLQARADLLNAKSAEIVARTQFDTARANLTAVLGLAEPVGELAQEGPMTAQVTMEPLEALVQRAQAQRPDVQAQRERLRARDLGIRQIGLTTGLRYELEASYSRTFTENQTERPSLVFTASLPVSDGGSARARTEAARALRLAEQASLDQTLLEVSSEVESAYREFLVSGVRLEAAQAAIDAARENFEAASAALRLEAADILEVTAAQTTLVTAETEFIQATFDQALSRARLELVLGEPMRGESN